MATDSRFFFEFFTFAQENLDEFSVKAVEAIASDVRPVANSLLGIYVVLHGISIAYGKIQEPVADSIFKLIRIAVIWAIAFNLGYYNIYVRNVAVNTPNQISSAFNPANTNTESSSVDTIDRAFNAGWEAGKRFYEKGGVIKGDFGMYIVAIFVWIATLLLCLYAAFLYLLAKIGLTILLALGPIFIVMTLFEQTKKFFESWVAQLFNYMMLQIITAAILGLTIGMFQTNSQLAVGDALGMDQAIFVCVIALLTTLVLAQAPSIASGLAGGASLGTQGAFAMVMGRATGAAKAGFRRTPLGRNLEASSAARQAARSQMAQNTGRALNARKYGSDKDSMAKAGAVAASRQIQPLQMAKSATTSGMESIGRLRTRLAARP